MSDMTPSPDSDAVELRERLARLQQALNSSRDQNPATLDALERAFPELRKNETLGRRPILAKLKRWITGRKAA